jgi:hypothetical protein
VAARTIEFAKAGANQHFKSGEDYAIPNRRNSEYPNSSAFFRDGLGAQRHERVFLGFELFTYLFDVLVKPVFEFLDGLVVESVGKLVGLV